MIDHNNDADIETIADEANNKNLLISLVGNFTSLPKVFHKPVAKVCEHLIFGANHFFLKKFNEVALDNRHRQQMTQMVRKALTDAVITEIPNRPDLIERAVNHFTAHVFGKQQSREDIVHLTIEELTTKTENIDMSRADLNEESKNIDEDWLDGFSRYAENASSERLKVLFSKILAGEIRSPNSCSLFTIDFLSKLSTKDAEKITQIAPYVMGACIPDTAISLEKISFTLRSDLLSLGIIVPPPPGYANTKFVLNTSNEFIFREEPSVAFLAGKKVLIVSTKKPKLVECECINLTSTGQEVLKLYDCEINPVMVNELISKIKSQNTRIYEVDHNDYIKYSAKWIEENAKETSI